jgi:hypothetical protein
VAQQFAVFSMPHYQYESGPFDSKELAEAHISRVLSNAPPGDLREFLVVKVGPFPASGRKR